MALASRKSRIGYSSAWANEKCQALALLTRSLGQRVPEAARYVHRTLLEGASSGSYPPDAKYARRPKRLSIDVKTKLTIRAARWRIDASPAGPIHAFRESDSGLFQKLTWLTVMSCGRRRFGLWTDSWVSCADSANHIT